MNELKTAARNALLASKFRWSKIERNLGSLNL